MSGSSVIHGYKPTNVVCPTCTARHGALERDTRSSNPNAVIYRCWCGATARGTLDEGDEGYVKS